jgi:hypothetical protein
MQRCRCGTRRSLGASWRLGNGRTAAVQDSALDVLQVITQVYNRNIHVTDAVTRKASLVLAHQSLEESTVCLHNACDQPDRYSVASTQLLIRISLFGSTLWLALSPVCL